MQGQRTAPQSSGKLGKAVKLACAMPAAGSKAVIAKSEQASSNRLHQMLPAAAAHSSKIGSCALASAFLTAAQHRQWCSRCQVAVGCRTIHCQAGQSTTAEVRVGRVPAAETWQCMCAPLTNVATPVQPTRCVDMQGC